MLFGISIEPIYIIGLGLFLGTLLVFQVLEGLRKIRFKGKTHMKVHRFVAWTILAVGLVHGVLALRYFGYI